MFKTDKNSDFKEAETIIGPSVKVEGDFVGQGNLIIEGVVRGSVKTDGNLRVGDKSKIEASVAAENAIISGEIKGDVNIKGDLELTVGAKILGDIETGTICIARGAFFSGKCTMNEGIKIKDDKKDNGRTINGAEEEIEA
ncbi:MAG: polymer-forming cytoskeletal protein [Patescibacteria group bacterium]|jgi:cytoskeletal protein CcmA (bactofilin family)